MTQMFDNGLPEHTQLIVRRWLKLVAGGGLEGYRIHRCVLARKNSWSVEVVGVNLAI
jgi:hypothetical protein